MQRYYYEFDFEGTPDFPSWGESEFPNDEAAAQFGREMNVLCVYKESDTVDGLPFITVYERD